MCICFRLIALLVLSLPINAAYAQGQRPVLTQRPEVVMIGAHWKISPKKQKSANVHIYWESSLNEDEMRSPSVDESRSIHMDTPFPLSADKQVYFNVNAFVTVSIDGKITECRFNPETPVEADTKIDPLAIAHACPMLTQKVQFYPALNNLGERIEIKGEVVVTYSMRIYNPQTPLLPTNNVRAPYQPTNNVRAPYQPPTKAGPPVPLLSDGGDITFETLSLSEQKMKERGISSLMAVLEVDIDGKASNCRLSAATFIDEIDRQICSRAMGINFAPATDEKGKITKGLYMLMLFVQEDLAE